MPHVELMLTICNQVHFKFIVSFLGLLYLDIPTWSILEAIDILIDQPYCPFGLLWWGKSMHFENFFRDDYVINLTSFLLFNFMFTHK